MRAVSKLIEFTNVELMLSIGIHPEERKARQRLMVSLTIKVVEENEADNIENTLDYDQVYHFLRNLEKTDHFDLQETVCRNVLDFVLELPGVETVSVSTRKVDVYEDIESVGLTMSATN